MNNIKPALTRDALILEVWEQLDSESAGATELQQIQTEVQNRLGLDSVDSPASIARILAEHGAILRHPEILELDTEWRERRISSFSRMDFSSLAGAVVAMREVESLRKRLEDSDSKAELSQLFDLVNGVRDELSLVALNKKMSSVIQAEAKEISEWLSLWRSSPDLFADWLDLRLDSPGFRALFPDFPCAGVI